jgi:hypothetical protein
MNGSLDLSKPDLKDRLSQAYHLATEAAQKAREKQKEGYDIRIRGAVIKPGDRVLVKVVSLYSIVFC